MTNSHLDRVKAIVPILRCPQTGTPLVLMTVSELSAVFGTSLQMSIAAGTVGALVSKAAFKAYPIVGPIVSFLDQDALHLPHDEIAESCGQNTDNALIKQKAKKWYDDFGWQVNESGLYGDTAMFSQVGETAHGFYEMHSHLSLLPYLLGGRFMLDAASGAVAHPEYLAYSWFYECRVCVDMSRSALQEAFRTVGDRGFYCMADICHLPFRENVFDGIVSGYTIQHIPQSDQEQAVRQLHRVLAPNKHCCILTGLQSSTPHRLIAGVFRRVMRLARRLAAEPSAIHASAVAAPQEELYCHLPSIGWWKRTVRSLEGDFAIETLRVLRKEEFEAAVGGSIRLAKCIRLFEGIFSRLLAPFSAYGLIRISKRDPR